MEALQALKTRLALIALLMRGRALRAKQRRTRARALGGRSYKSIWRKVNEIANFPGCGAAERFAAPAFAANISRKTKTELRPTPEGKDRIETS